MMLALLVSATGAWADVVYASFKPSTEGSMPATKDCISLQTTVEDYSYLICRGGDAPLSTTITGLNGHKITKIVLYLNSESLKNVLDFLDVSEDCNVTKSVGNCTVTFTNKVSYVTLSMTSGHESSDEIKTTSNGLLVYYDDEYVPEHQHNYSEEWYYDQSTHYHFCLTNDDTTCDAPRCDEAPHNYGQCINGAEYYTCQTCGREDIARRNQTHSYTPTFNWSDDCESCTATVTCSCGDVYPGQECIVTPSQQGRFTTYTATLNFNEENYSDNIVQTTLHANADPSYPSTGYYTTFYDHEIAYTVGNGATAYIGTISDDNLLLTPIEDGIIPRDEAVIIRSNSDKVSLSLSNSTKDKSVENRLQGSDTDTEAPDGCYILSYGQNGLGFYRYAKEAPLAAHKAFLIYSRGSEAKGLRLIFADDDVNGIDNVNENEDENANIYNLCGQRINSLQKGINIVGGKKVVKK